MLSVLTHRPIAAAVLSRAIGVGVHDRDHDRAAIQWVLDEARPQHDTVHLVRAYVPLHLEEWKWDRGIRARDARYHRARRLIAQSVQQVKKARGELLVGGSAVAGLPEDVLIELSSVVDLLVIGDDSATRSWRRKISWRVQDHARCPVVAVPAGYRSGFDGRPVTVVVGECGLSGPTAEFAAAAADRRGVALQVSRTCSSPDARSGMGDDWLESLRSGSSLLVTSAGSAALVRSTSNAAAASCPIAIVPE